MTVEWVLGETTWNDLIQVTDNYVVHARGFTVGDNIWLDEYSVHRSHYHLWDTQMEEFYEAAEYSGRWGEYDPEIDESVLYWSITGAPTFIVQHPKTLMFDDRALEQLKGTLQALDCPNDVSVRIQKPETSGNGHAKSILQSVKDGGTVVSSRHDVVDIISADGVSDL